MKTDVTGDDATREPRDDAAEAGREVRFHLESFENFVIFGWGAAGSAAFADIELWSNGQPVPCRVSRRERQDVAAALGIEALATGFAIELPGDVWTGVPEGEPCRLQLRADGTFLPTPPLVLERARAVEWLAAIGRMPATERQLHLSLALEHLCYGQLLPLLGRETASVFRALAVSLGMRELTPVEWTRCRPTGERLPVVARPEVRANLEGVRQFTMYGWAVTGTGPAQNFEVFCNGTPVESRVVRKERRDVAEALKLGSLDLGFEIELPGYIWESVADNDFCRLELSGDGTALTAEPIKLVRAEAAEWIVAISRMADGPEKQYYALLALEHVRFGRLLHDLDEETIRFLRDLARQMRLEEYAFADGQGGAPVGDFAETEAGTLLLWKALRRLNARLGDSAAEVYPQVKAVLDELLQDDGINLVRAAAQPSVHSAAMGKAWRRRHANEVRRRFLFSVMPLLCRTGEFLKLNELVDFGSLHALARSEDLWEMSLAIPPLVADGHLDEATELLWRISRRLDGGWLNTDCIRFAVEWVQELETDGEIGLPAAEKFRYAFIGLLDGFNGEWFSRLHDRELIDATIFLLRDLDRYTTYHKRDLVSAAVRHYGLCPTFWQRLPVPSNAWLIRARDAWQSLQAVLERRDRPLSEQLDDLLEPIAFFHRQGNVEIQAVLREIVANCLPTAGGNPSAAGRILIESLLASSPAEALRLAAFPLSAENALLTVAPEVNEHLFGTLRQLSEREKSLLYDLQCKAATALQAAQAAVEGRSPAAIASAVSRLEYKAIALNNPQGGFLGVDLLASAYLMSVEAGMEADILLTRLGDIIRRIVQDADGNGYLPPAVCTALARLAANPDNPGSLQFLKEMKAVVGRKFGTRHDVLFSRPTVSFAITEPAVGWPQDTLVVVYSCRKYLETRIPAIRATWVRDLRERGIPYVILVGDGDDSLQGDVLALDVSDRYEDLPQKTLKLFDWVYHQTAAQYVLKIDDDCYLDVGRYFDTLSYRRHFYYGRVIHRAPGGTDRLWHQPKSHSRHGRNAIDKSPEPSVYADGGGGYCLSRLAIEQLLAAAGTPAGERLKACSFMEDKLVGDLLALCHIGPANEDYESYQRRRTFGEAMPVGMVENTFFPSRLSPTKVVHLDTEKDLAVTRARAGKEELWPKKLWPTCWLPEIRHNSNQLELLTAPPVAEKLLRHELVVIAVVRNEMVMLPHFLAHYRRLGIGCFVFVDNCSDDGTREFLFAQPDAVLYSADTEYRQSHYGVAWQQAILGNLCLGKWALLVDADELLVFEGCEQRSLADFVATVAAEGADAVRTDMIDMYPHGDLEEADFAKLPPFEAAPWFDAEPLIKWQLGSGMYSNGVSCLSALRHRLDGAAAPNSFTSQKYALIRYQPWIRYSQGLHDAANVTVSTRRAWLAHFKYHAGFKAKVQTEIRRGQHFNDAVEYRRYAAMLAEGQGGFGAEGVSVRYAGSHSFAQARNMP